MGTPFSSYQMLSDLWDKIKPGSPPITAPSLDQVGDSFHGALDEINDIYNNSWVGKTLNRIQLPGVNSTNSKVSIPTSKDIGFQSGAFNPVEGVTNQVRGLTTLPTSPGDALAKYGPIFAPLIIGMASKSLIKANPITKELPNPEYIKAYEEGRDILQGEYRTNPTIQNRNSPEYQAALDKQRSLPPYIDTPTGVNEVPTYHSALLDVFNNPKLANKMTGDQALRMVKATPGVKPSELSWTGTDEFLKSRGIEGKFTKQEIYDHINNNQIDVHEQVLDDPGFAPPSPYTWPGGKNYREIVLKWANRPPNKTPGLAADGSPSVFPPPTGDFYGPPVHQAISEVPNVLAHMRVEDRINHLGGKDFHIVENQSDWRHDLAVQNAANADPTTTWNYQASKILHEKGFGEYAPINKADFDAMTDPNTPMGSGANFGKQTSVPNAPLVNDYTSLISKRVMRMAAEGGYDSISWPTGDQQQSRYMKPLLEKVDSINYNPATQKLDVFKDGKITQSHLIPVESLPKYIGNDASRNLLESLHDPSSAPVTKYRVVDPTSNLNRIQSTNHLTSDSANESLHRIETMVNNQRTPEEILERPYNLRVESYTEGGPTPDIYNSSNKPEAYLVPGFNKYSINPTRDLMLPQDYRERMGMTENLPNPDTYHWESTHGKILNYQQQYMSKDAAHVDAPQGYFYRDHNGNAIQELNPPLSNPTGSISGSNLTIGKKGLYKVYDSDMPKDYDTIGKKFGTKSGFGKIEVNTGKEVKESFQSIAQRTFGRDVNDLTMAEENQVGRIYRDQNLQLTSKPELRDVHMIHLNPSLRQSIPTKSFPLFQLPLGAGAGALASRLLRNQSQDQQ